MLNNTIKSQYINYKILINICLKQTIIENNKNVIQFEIKNYFILIVLLNKLYTILIKFIVNKSKIFKFKIILMKFENNKFKFENNIVILSIKNIELNFILNIVLCENIMQLLLRFSQILQSSFFNVKKSLFFIEQNIKNMLSINITFFIN